MTPATKAPLDPQDVAVKLQGFYSDLDRTLDRSAESPNFALDFQWFDELAEDLLKVLREHGFPPSVNADMELATKPIKLLRQKSS